MAVACPGDQPGAVQDTQVLAHRAGTGAGLPVGLGRSNAEIAEELHVSMATVKTHLGHLLEKLGARDRVQLVIVGYESGLLVPRHRV